MPDTYFSNVGIDLEIHPPSLRIELKLDPYFGARVPDVGHIYPMG